MILDVLDANSLFAWLCDHLPQATAAGFAVWLYAVFRVARWCVRLRVWETGR